ncbi:MAG: DUF4373 domain-containing protein, partial [Oscillospiraceae bacterium]
EIVRAAIKRGMFDKELYDKYQVLTSRGIQKRYFEVVSRRKVITVNDNILLVNVAQICSNANIISENVNINPENVSNNPQSKVKESKVKESRVFVADKPQPKHFIPPTLDEVTEYCKQRKNNVEAKRFVDYYSANDWVDGKGNKVKNWKQKLITWEKSEMNYGAGSKPKDNHILEHSGSEMDELDRFIMYGKKEGE